MRDTLLFDLDGTLIDSIPLIVASFRHTLQTHLGEAPSDAALVRGIGTPLRTQLGLLQLRLDPPEAAEALEQLRTAEVALRGTDAGVLDLAANRLGQARAVLLLGRADESEAIVAAGLDQVGEDAPLLAAEAHLQLGEVAMARGHVAAARTGFQQAVMRLSGVGADRQAAQLWFDLGELLEQVGEAALARVRAQFDWPRVAEQTARLAGVAPASGTSVWQR